MAVLLTLALLLTLDLGGAGAADSRSHALVDLECTTSELSNQLTLFANGTLRLVNRSSAGEEMKLGELDRQELEDFSVRLQKIDLAESESQRFGPGGEGVEQCRLRIAWLDETETSYRFSRLDSLSLGLSSFLKIVEELRVEAIARHRGDGLPYGYVPRVGDVLLRADGSRFEVAGMTTGGGGVEMRGLDNPLVLYLAVAELGSEFVAIEQDPER